MLKQIVGNTLKYPSPLMHIDALMIDLNLKGDNILHSRCGDAYDDVNRAGAMSTLQRVVNGIVNKDGYQNHHRSI